MLQFSNMQNQEQLENLNKKWTTECECELRKTATQAVPGDGSANAEIVFHWRGAGTIGR